MNRILLPLAAGYRMGVALRASAYRRGWIKTQRLKRPVISVGNLSVGGTGKTPFVAYLADRLRKHGWKPDILTRGYGRREGPELVVIEPGAGRAPDPREVGDEPALLARKLPSIPIVVSTDRYRAGRLAEETFNVDVHILDDGFQHFALARDFDIVLLDVTQELSDSALLPAGRLREPCASLGRSQMVVLTRSELGDSRAIEATVQRLNPQAGMFHCSTTPHKLWDYSSGTAQALTTVGSDSVYAFCGIGNPAAFFANLIQWGFSVTGQTAFPDHHVYQAREIKRVIAMARKTGAKYLLTTEKDALNFPLLDKTELPILSCVIESEVREADAFEKALVQGLKRLDRSDTERTTA